MNFTSFSGRFWGMSSFVSFLSRASALNLRRKKERCEKVAVNSAASG